MTRAAKAVINLAALRQNLQRARGASPASQQYAVIKANGYGHGMVQVAKALSDADGFCVASVEEAVELRTAGIPQPILLLEGFFHSDEIDAILQHQLEVVVHHESQLVLLESFAKRQSDHEQTIPVWLKVDTGMHRLGFSPVDVTAAYQRLQDCTLVAQSPHLMTHLACADDFYHPLTMRQIQTFKKLLSQYDCKRSIANSAGILGWVPSHSNIDRPGILLYGVSPFIDETAEARRLSPAMTLSSELIAIKHCAKGETVGYGGVWQCPEDMPIGVISIGYGDGYPRHAVSGTPVLINGQRVPLIGRVSMDMICVDLRTLPGAKIGDTAILWGEGLPAEEVAASASTIAYELLCAVTSRVPRVYVDVWGEGHG